MTFKFKKKSAVFIKILSIGWCMDDFICHGYKLHNYLPCRLHASCHPQYSPWSFTTVHHGLCLVRDPPPNSLFPNSLLCLHLTVCISATCSFSRLFSSSSSVPAMKKAECQSNVKYNAPGSLVKRSSTFSQFPTEKSKTFDFLNEE